jgi:hypothetical protein
MKQKKVIIALSSMLFSKDIVPSIFQSEEICETLYLNDNSSFYQICLNAVQNETFAKILSDYSSIF